MLNKEHEVVERRRTYIYISQPIEADPTEQPDTEPRNSESRIEPNSKTTFQRPGSCVGMGMLRFKPNFPNGMVFTLPMDTLDSV